ncbi:MAG: hypothetical protein HQK77_12825 [Desulfobacterales bacterium]|nr:hypothetical protein [Desulfobacterales bacterium]
MNMNALKPVMLSNFLDQLVIQNELCQHGFDSWFFHEGMCFQSMEIWWNNSKKRSMPHEGVDVCFYADIDHELKMLGTDADIPAIFSGECIHICKDFIGETLVLGHDIYNSAGHQLLTFYAHVDTKNTISLNTRIITGDIIAWIAPVSKPSVLPHLHLSVAWISPDYSISTFDWKTYHHDSRLQFCNPMNFFSYGLNPCPRFSE